jgi:hypothetical protein
MSVFCALSSNGDVTQIIYLHQLHSSDRSNPLTPEQNRTKLTTPSTETGRMDLVQILELFELLARWEETTNRDN